jgi:hypothetical protein
LLTTEDLFLASLALKQDPKILFRTREALRRLSRLDLYTDWAGGLEQLQPFELPDDFDALALVSLGLALPAHASAPRPTLQVRVNLAPGGLFVTDGLWVPGAVRAFPFSDESTALIGLAGELDWLDPDQVVIDVASGCGQAGLSAGAGRVVLLDVSPRALAYAELNRLLNRREGVKVGCLLSDLREGLPVEMLRAATADVLVLANVPFAPASDAKSLPLTSNGGPSGLDLQEDVFKGLVSLRKKLAPTTRLRALVMGLTAGRAREGDWELPAAADRTFAEAGVEASTQWHLLVRESLLRINGQRAVPNPCTIRPALEAFSSCKLYHPQATTRDRLRKEYGVLADAFVSRSLTHLAFGVLQLELKGASL